MTSELDIFVGNTTLIDEDVYRLWLDGYSGLWGTVCGCRFGGAIVLDGRAGRARSRHPIGQWAEAWEYRIHRGRGWNP